MTFEKRTLFELMQPLKLRFNSAFFQTDEKTRLREVFLSAAVDILSADPENKVLFFTPADPRMDPPRDNVLLQDLISTGRFRVVSYHNAHRELQYLLQATDTYGYLHHLCIFAENVDRCIPREALHLLPEIMERGSGKSLRVFVSMMLAHCIPAWHPLHRFISLPQVMCYRLWRNVIPGSDKTATLLVPSDDLPGKVKQLLKAEKERKREEKRKNRKNTPPTLTQIILAVTAALLTFIASRLGG